MKSILIIMALLSINSYANCISQYRSRLQANLNIGREEGFELLGLTAILLAPKDPSASVMTSAGVSYFVAARLYRAKQLEKILKVYNETKYNWGPYLNQFAAEIDPTLSKEIIKNALAVLNDQNICFSSYDELVDAVREAVQ